MIGGRILKNWEEGVGVLHHLDHDEGNLVGKIGRLALLLPSEMEDQLRPMVGKKIGILRTDDGYLWRAISS